MLAATLHLLSCRQGWGGAGGQLCAAFPDFITTSEGWSTPLGTGVGVGGVAETWAWVQPCYSPKLGACFAGLDLQILSSPWLIRIYQPMHVPVPIGAFLSVTRRTSRTDTRTFIQVNKFPSRKC